MGQSQINAVLWDLDDTICTHPTSTAELLAEAFDNAGVDPFFTADEFEQWIPRVNGESQLDLREKCFTAIAKQKDVPPELARDVASAYHDPDPRDVELNPGAMEALDALNERYKMGLVTNGAKETQQIKLDTLGITDYFATLIFATPESALKPDPDPFRWALEELNVNPRESVYIGNSLESDVTGATAADIQAIWLADERDVTDPSPEPDFIINSLRELRSPPWE